MCKNCEEKKTVNKITVDIRQKGKDNQVIETNGCVYIKMGKYTYYFDNSCGDCYISRWLTDSENDYSESPTEWKHYNEMTTDEWFEHILPNK